MREALGVIESSIISAIQNKDIIDEKNALIGFSAKIGQQDETIHKCLQEASTDLLRELHDKPDEREKIIRKYVDEVHKTGFDQAKKLILIQTVNTLKKAIDILSKITYKDADNVRIALYEIKRGNYEFNDEYIDSIMNSVNTLSTLKRRETVTERYIKIEKKLLQQKMWLKQKNSLLRKYLT
jgi:hypothetical protein